MKLVVSCVADFVEATSGVPTEQLAAACPYPALLELPAGGPALEPLARDDAAGLDARLGALATAGAAAPLTFLAGGEPLLIGSTPEAEIGGGVAGLSPRHAQLLWHRGAWRVKDLESDGGTRVEGQRIPVGVPLPLQGGEVLSFGRALRVAFLPPQALMRFAALARDGAAPPLLPPEGLWFSDLCDCLAEGALDLKALGPFLLEVPRGEADASPADPTNAGITQLTTVAAILGGRRGAAHDALRVHSLRGCGERPLLVGRAAGCDVVLGHATVSKRHAQLRLQAGTVSVVDLDSANGTYVGGERLPPSIARELRDGEVISFGRYAGMLLSGPALLVLARSLRRAQGAGRPARARRAG